MTGACLCGAVRFRGEGRPEGISVCHCGQCRVWSAGPLMVVWFPGGVAVEAGDTLAWYGSSDHGERGFCTRCGSSLFWRSPGEPRAWAASANALAQGGGLAIREHIWVEDAAPWDVYAADAARKTAAECLAEARS